MAPMAGGNLSFEQFMFPGVIAMTVLFTAVFAAVSIVWDREFGFLKEVMVAPVSRRVVALGKVAGGSTLGHVSRSADLDPGALLGISSSRSSKRCICCF